MKNEFDNKVTDKGWQSMRRLLDLEMPEQRRRRRFGWWPFALLLLPLGGLGGWWFAGQPEPENVTLPPVQAPKLAEPVVTIEKNTEKHDPNSSRTIYSSDEFSHSSDDSKSSGELSNQSNHSPNNPTSSYATFSSDDLKSPDESSNPSPNNSKSTYATHSSDDSKSSAELPKDFPPLPTSLQFIEKNSKNPINPVPVVAYLPEKIKKQPSPKRGSFGLSAGLTSEGFSSLNGFSAGTAVDWRFARKWGLRSGLQYAQYRLPASRRPIVSLEAADYTNATGNSLNLGGGATPAADQISEVLVPVERLRKLEMPLSAYWQPFRFLRIFSGATTAYTLSAQASEQNYANNSQIVVAGDQLAQKNLNDLTASTLSRWSLDWQIGTGVVIGRHLELNVSYRSAFDNKRDNASDLLFDPGNFSGSSADPQLRSVDANSWFHFTGIWFF